MSGLGCTQGSSDLKESLRTQLMQRFPQREILQAGEVAFELGEPPFSRMTLAVEASFGHGNDEATILQGCHGP